MKNISLVIFAIVICSCSTSNSNKFDYNKSKNAWLDAFKDQAFFACLRESYKNDSIFKLIEKEDAFNPYDDLNPEAITIAKNNGKNVSENIPPPAMCENCNEGENYYMATYAEKLKSPEWEMFRLEIMKSNHWKCENCQNKKIKKQ